MRAQSATSLASASHHLFDSMTAIAIIDYQMGNLRSVQKGFEKVGHAATITSDPRELAAADKIVLPGVGAFGDAMAELRRRDLVGPIRDAVAAGKPFLGICLGLQLLFDVGYEGGEHEGLGILRGKVVRFDLPRELKVPHMGWNRGQVLHASSILKGIDEGAFFYFVHSYHCVPDDQEVVAVQCDYGGLFCAEVQLGTLFAKQLHPVKSQAQGLKILQNFAQM